MPFLELFDETLDINSTENYELSIQVSPDGLSFCLLDRSEINLFMLRSFGAEENKYFNADKISELLSKDDFLTKRLKKDKLRHAFIKIYSCPDRLFMIRVKKMSISDSIIIFRKTILFLLIKHSDPDAFLVFSISRSINELIRSVYPEIHPHHHVKVLLEHTH